MVNEKEKIQEEKNLLNPNVETIEVDNFGWTVPQCCKEGWDSCPHVVKRQKIKSKRNIGL